MIPEHLITEFKRNKQWLTVDNVISLLELHNESESRPTHPTPEAPLPSKPTEQELDAIADLLTSKLK